MLLNKAKSASGDELLKKKYLIYLQKRRRKLEGARGYLKDLVHRLETLEIGRSHALGMCPDVEKNRRIEMNEVDYFFEKNSKKFIKKFSRSSADKHLDDPVYLRPPFFLLKTTEYIIKNILDDDTKEKSDFLLRDGERCNFFDIYQFASDRFRGMCQDIKILRTHCEEILASKTIITVLE